MKHPLLKIALLILVDLILLWSWVGYMDPDASVSIMLLFLLPALFVVNIVIAVILAILKKKKSAGLFVLNALITPVLMFFIFDAVADGYQHRHCDTWHFRVNDAEYELTHWRPQTSFCIARIKPSDAGWHLICGDWEPQGEVTYLRTKTAVYAIKGHYLYGFTKQVIRVDKD